MAPGQARGDSEKVLLSEQAILLKNDQDDLRRYHRLALHRMCTKVAQCSARNIRHGIGRGSRLAVAGSALIQTEPVPVNSRVDTKKIEPDRIAAFDFLIILVFIRQVPQLGFYIFTIGIIIVVGKYGILLFPIDILYITVTIPFPGGILVGCIGQFPGFTE